MKQIVQLEADFKKEWIEFTKKYQFDPELGYLISDQHQIKCFDFEPLKIVLDILPELNENGKIVQVAQSFQNIKLTQPFSFKDMVILHDATAMIVQSYVLQKLKTIKQSEIKVPGNLAEPLYISSDYLKCSPGNITVYQYNWKIQHKRYIDDPFDLTYQDVDLKWYFTIQKTQEANFFVLNFIGSFYMWKILREVYFANFLVLNAPWLEKQIIAKLKKAAQFWEKVTEENTKMVSMMNVYFNKKLRPYISGFNDVYFQKVDKRLSAARGNTGFDPSYQLFQEYMGVSYKDCNQGFEKLRIQMRKVMAKIHCQAIQEVYTKTNLRGYCKNSEHLAQAYNKILANQIKFTKLHNQFVNKYIQQFTPGIQNSPPFCFILKKSDSLEENFLNFSQKV